MINLEKEIRQQPEVLAGVGAANAEKIKALVAEAKKRGIRNVTIAARGTSDHAAIYGQYLLAIAAGIPCGLATPSAVSRYGADIDYSGHLVIGVSQSGMAEDVLLVIEDAKRHGALTASVTNNESSPLAKAVDFSLFCNAGPETSIAATKTFTSQLYIMAALAAEWGGDKSLEKALGTLPEITEKVLSDMPSALEPIAEKYKDLSAASILGRGLLYPIALEGALKILETNKIKMRGYAVSDFHHGPKAQIGKGDLAIILACDGKTYDDEKEICRELLSVGGEVIVITDKKDDFGGATVLTVPSSDYKYPDAVTAFCCAITLQLLALKLTEVRGIDPDASEVLKKVTVTV